MFYDKELRFLRDVLEKVGMPTHIVSPKAPIALLLDDTLTSLFSDASFAQTPATAFLGRIEPHTFYKLTGAYKFSYIYFRLPEPDEETLFFLGPYLSAPLPTPTIADMAADFGVSPKNRDALNKFCAGVPIVPESSPVFLMLDTFCEHLWGGASYAIVDVNKEDRLPASPINHAGDSETADDILFKMQIMEKRYHYENELMQAVTRGQMNKANELFAAFSELTFDKRVSDPLRNMKNYCIIMNTLLRKAAEQGGAHPLYLDSVSSGFAVKIETADSISEIGDLMRDMFRSYCRLVRKHSMKDYSPLVQNTIIFIESDLSANLSLRMLAEAMKVSAGYLSTEFKRETGKTVTAYIREKRIKHATHLLSTTHLQIQTVALHCGIMDLQYFSKLFKRQTGLTPKEYRESIKQ